MGNRALPLSTEDSGVQGDDRYQNNIIITDLSEELMAEDDAGAKRRETGLTEVRIQIEGKEIKL